VTVYSDNAKLAVNVDAWMAVQRYFEVLSLVSTLSGNTVRWGGALGAGAKLEDSL
jgi:hypothetical protein